LYSNVPDRNSTLGVDLTMYMQRAGTAVAQWLRLCATNRKVAGFIPAGVIGIFQ